jgi:hypothetical protein
MSFQFYDDLDKFDQLESERTSIMNDPKYQQWVKELHISQSYVEPDGMIRAKQLNEQYDYSNISPKSSFLNFLKIKGIW